jgi:hypothetical protein
MDAAWTTYQTARTGFAASWQGPRRPMTFLSDMRQIGVLHSAGIAHQFRHVELQHQLAVNTGQALKATARNVETYRTLPKRRVAKTIRLASHSLSSFGMPVVLTKDPSDMA